MRRGRASCPSARLLSLSAPRWTRQDAYGARRESGSQEAAKEQRQQQVGAPSIDPSRAPCPRHDAASPSFPLPERATTLSPTSLKTQKPRPARTKKKRGAPLQGALSPTPLPSFVPPPLPPGADYPVAHPSVPVVARTMSAAAAAAAPAAAPPAAGGAPAAAAAAAPAAPAPEGAAGAAAPAAAGANPAPAQNSSLYVGDLDRDATEASLYELFSQVRRISLSFCARRN